MDTININQVNFNNFNKLNNPNKVNNVNKRTTTSTSSTTSTSLTPLVAPLSMDQDSLQQWLASATLLIVVVGCLGNLLSLVLFLRHSSSVNTLLAALSAVDLCLLLLAVPVFVLPALDIW